MISARAIAVLEELALDPDHGAARGISSRVGEGREAVQSAINELRGEGLIKTSTVKHYNGNVISTILITDTGHRLLETRIHRLLYVLNKQNALLVPKAYLAYSSIKIVIGEADGEKDTMDEWHTLGQMDTDHEEIARFKREEKISRQQEFERLRAAKVDKKINSLREIKPIDWTIDNGVHEFARRMVRWDIPPWEGSRRRFQAAYATARKTYGTKGPIESKMMDYFFDTLAHENSIKDPDKIWKMFIKSFGSIYHEVTVRSTDLEQLVKAKEAALKEWDKF